MSVCKTLWLHAALGIPLGLLLGLALGPVARRVDGWGGYASLPRRAARLGHIAAVALPFLSGLYGLLLDQVSRAPHGAATWAAPMWVAGSVLLVLALWLGARFPQRLPLLLPLPACSLVIASVGLAAALVPPLLNGVL